MVTKYKPDQAIAINLQFDLPKKVNEISISSEM